MFEETDVLTARGSDGHRSCSRHPSRRAVTLFEMIISLGVAGVLSASMVPMLRWSHLQQRASDRRIVAQEEVRNVMERVAVLPWSELKEETVKEWKLSPEVAAQLPDSQLTIRVDDQAEATPPARRVQVELTWRVGQQTTAPVRVTSWFHPPAGENP